MPFLQNQIHVTPGVVTGRSTRSAIWSSAFFLKLKQFRRVATRYDKLASSFLAFVYLASIAILLK